MSVELPTPEQVERLALLAEEMGEAIQIIGKIQRHGYDSCSPLDPDHKTNRELLTKELGDVRAAYALLWLNEDVDHRDVTRAQNDKLQRVGRWLHHKHQGVLN